MVKINRHYGELENSYLFFNISQKVNAFQESHPEAKILRLGIGDVTRPLCPAVIDALHGGVADQGRKETFRGYQSELGCDFLRQAIARNYQKYGVEMPADDVFVSSGASDDLAHVLSLFDEDNTVIVMEPAYPAYVDANVIAGHRIVHLPSGQENGFLPLPDGSTKGDIVYICSPNNPTGAVYSREGLQKWVDWARANGSVLLFDAAYEAFIEEDLPRSIYEVEGARECAIEIRSFSKTAGFTGTRCGYTVVPSQLQVGGVFLRDMWIRDRTTKSNGVSYIIQRGAEAVFSEAGWAQSMENVAYYKENARIIMRTLDKLGLWYCGGKNAPYVWHRCPRDMDSWAYFDYLLEHGQVVGTPGVGFGQSGEGYFRLTTFSTREATEEAMDRMYNLFK